MMKTSILRSQFYFPKLAKLTTPSANSSHFIPTQTNLSRKGPSKLTSPLPKQFSLHQAKASHIDKSINLELKSKSQNQSKEEFSLLLPKGNSRFVILGAVSIGFVLLLMGIDSQKAFAFGPEGPLMEEFWDNVRRYGLYILTVSTGAIYTIFQPILELLKNPISAILILTILGGSFYIVTQVVSAMVGVTDFSYDYGY